MGQVVRQLPQGQYLNDCVESQQLISRVRVAQAVDRITNLFSPTSSFKHYRMAIRAAKRPGCPYLGTFLCDLVYLEECNPDNIMSGTRELINFSKRKAIFEIISQVLYFRDQPYTFEVVRAVGNSLLGMMTSPDVVTNQDNLCSISKQLEPKKGAP